ncbi:hypothetical protein CEQ21_20515 [Niallia circulans]|uniref:Uncharacterized protein n=1 Tax=Niallia circulans TaxID=1397 RepID=A0A553SLE4_NIACI|nr:hypothetical protein [Niallia circulans]TRZ37815.1 hypothetical protein CEQ21_20515 [Niallia circulans]
MRLLFRKMSYHQMKEDMKQMEQVLCSKSFLYIDLFLIGIMISFAVSISFNSLLVGAVAFFIFYTVFATIFHFLSKWLKDSPAEE